MEDRRDASEARRRLADEADEAVLHDEVREDVGLEWVRWRVEIKGSAPKGPAAIPLKARRRVDAAIRALAGDPRPPRAKKLSGPGDLCRVRTGDYRIIYTVRDEALPVLVPRVGHRRHACRRPR